MALLDEVLRVPAYGWTNQDAEFSKPTTRMLFKEFFNRLNVFADKRNWLPFVSWLKILVLFPFLLLFATRYFSCPLLVLAFFYGMVLMGTHGTIWYHRFCTHGAYSFSHRFWRFVTRNLTLSIIPEEIYVVSHHVHHAKSDTPGDPYNAAGGFWYCFLADVNHQPISISLSPKNYAHVRHLMRHTGLQGNDYHQYQYWGSFAHPIATLTQWALNWAFWMGVFYVLGGMALVSAILASAFVWAVGVRTFNYEGHGKGKDKRQAGADFNFRDMSVNQWWPGWVAGEWHNNHHLYPKSARSGFLAHQPDLAWLYIKLLHRLGAVSSYHNCQQQFLQKHYQPYQQKITLHADGASPVTSGEYQD